MSFPNQPTGPTGPAGPERPYDPAEPAYPPYDPGQPFPDEYAPPPGTPYAPDPYAPPPGTGYAPDPYAPPSGAAYPPDPYAPSAWSPPYPPGSAPAYGQPPPPSHAPRSQASSGTADSFTNWVAFLIAVVSIVSALVAWRASLAQNDAQGLDIRAIQELAQVQQARQGLQSLVDQDRRFVARAQEHLLTAKQLRAEADSIRATDATRADQLDQQAQDEDALARVLSPFFLAAGGIVLGDNDQIGYDAAYVQRNLEQNDETMRQLHPDETRTSATIAHARALDLIGIALVLVVSLFFLTLAEVGRRRLRVWFAAAGGLGAIAAVAALVAVEVIGTTVRL